MDEHWYKRAVIYCLDVDTFQDSDDDGVGDLRGLIRRLDHLARLGVTCLWLNPIQSTPDRDDGYDVADFYSVDPRLGTLGDLVELVHQATNRGLRTIIDLVVNHTSDQHPWFQSARSDPASPYRDWYVWSSAEPADPTDGVVFPGVQQTTWTWDDTAGAWYHHRFYDFQPDLNWANPEVRAEIAKVTSFWLQLGISGFRMDAAPFVIEDTRPDRTEPLRRYEWLDELRAHVSWRRGDALILAEANVERDELTEFFGDGHRLPMLFNFALNQRLFLALARGSAAPLREALAAMPAIPDACSWATFLRNHDEIDLSGLSDAERAECFEAFGPEPDMQLYGRGIRRRLAPMLDGDQDRIRMAYALQCGLPGTPVLRYGDEIGMGEDLSLKERYSIRTPMQWSADPGAGFSRAPKKRLVRPLVDDDRFGYEQVNVDEQRDREDSLLAWFERMLRSLRECPEIGAGQPSLLDPGDHRVLAVRYCLGPDQVVTLTNLSAEATQVDLRPEVGADARAIEMFANRRYTIQPDLDGLDLDPYGYRWLRLTDATDPGS